MDLVSSAFGSYGVYYFIVLLFAKIESDIFKGAVNFFEIFEKFFCTRVSFGFLPTSLRETDLNPWRLKNRSIPVRASVYNVVRFLASGFTGDGISGGTSETEYDEELLGESSKLPLIDRLKRLRLWCGLPITDEAKYKSVSKNRGRIFQLNFFKEISIRNVCNISGNSSATYNTKIEKYNSTSLSKNN